MLDLQHQNRKPQHHHQCPYPQHLPLQISSHPSLPPTTLTLGIINSHQAIGQPTIRSIIIHSSLLPNRPRRQKREEMAEWVDIGKNSIRKVQTLLILMLAKVWRRPGRRRRGERRWSSRNYQVTKLNTRSASIRSFSLLCSREAIELGWMLTLLSGNRADQGSRNRTSSTVIVTQYSFHPEGGGQSTSDSSRRRYGKLICRSSSNGLRPTRKICGSLLRNMVSTPILSTLHGPG